MTLALMVYELKHETNLLQGYLNLHLVPELHRVKIGDRLEVIRERIRELEALPYQEMIVEQETTYLEIQSKEINGK